MAVGVDLVVLVRKLLSRYGIRVRKRLGQHFVVSKELIDELVDSVRRLEPRHVVEVGTGLGFLTRYLTNVAESVVSVEIDRRLAEVSKDLLKDAYGVNLVVSDGVLFIKAALRIPHILVSNVPYNITGPLLMALIRSNCESAVLTLQEEVASRLAAVPGSRGYSRVSVMVNTFMDVRLGGRYPPDSFYPPPKVNSRVVILRRVRGWRDDWSVYEALVRCMFNQRRRLARKVLGRCVSELGLSLDVNDVSRFVGDRRVYELPVETFIEVFKHVLSHSGEYFR